MYLLVPGLEPLRCRDISACETDEQPERALELFEMRKQEGCAGVITFNALISACVKVKQPERALELIDMIKQEGYYRM